MSFDFNLNYRHYIAARVVMIDGEPVLRSNAYSMEEGEPSVFDKELGVAAPEEEAGGSG